MQRLGKCVHHAVAAPQIDAASSSSQCINGQLPQQLQHAVEKLWQIFDFNLLKELQGRGEGEEGKGRDA